MRGYQKELQNSVEGMSWWKKNVFVGKESNQVETDIKKIYEIRDDGFDDLRLNLARWSEEITRGRDAGPDQAVVYYREQEGRGALKAYYTSDLQVIGVGP